MDLTLSDKIKYYTKYLYDAYFLKLFPYKNTIIYNNNIDSYVNESQRLNYVSWGYNYSLKFPEKRRIVIDYSGDKEFNTVFFAQSHNEINDITNKILKDVSLFHKKIKINFPNFIENVYLIKDSDVVDVTEIINNSIDCKNNITFSDITLLAHENLDDIKNIKVIYVKMMKKYTKEFKFAEYRNIDIDILNDIYNV